MGTPQNHIETNRTTIPNYQTNGVQHHHNKKYVPQILKRINVEDLSLSRTIPLETFPTDTYRNQHFSYTLS